MSRITPPKTYSEWVTVLDVLQSHTDDEAVLNAMQCNAVRLNGKRVFPKDLQRSLST